MKHIAMLLFWMVNSACAAVVTVLALVVLAPDALRDLAGRGLPERSSQRLEQPRESRATLVAQPEPVDSYHELELSDDLSGLNALADAALEPDASAAAPTEPVKREAPGEPVTVQTPRIAPIESAPVIVQPAPAPPAPPPGFADRYRVLTVVPSTDPKRGMAIVVEHETGERHYLQVGQRLEEAILIGVTHDGAYFTLGGKALHLTYTPSADENPETAPGGRLNLEALLAGSSTGGPSAPAEQPAADGHDQPRPGSGVEPLDKDAAPGDSK